MAPPKKKKLHLTVSQRLKAEEVLTKAGLDSPTIDILLNRAYSLDDVQDFQYRASHAARTFWWAAEFVDFQDKRLLDAYHSPDPDHVGIVDHDSRT